MSQMREFHLTVEARDGEGHGHLFDHTTVNIQVLNVNEHKPMFVMPALPNATVEITEVGSLIVFCSNGGHDWF